MADDRQSTKTRPVLAPKPAEPSFPWWMHPLFVVLVNTVAIAVFVLLWESL